MKAGNCAEPVLETWYRTAKTLLPELGISNDSVAYYAALVDYYTVQKLQQLPAGMARLYLLCFLLQRYQKINDNLVNALIYHVRKVNTTAKACMEQQVLAFPAGRQRQHRAHRSDTEPVPRPEHRRFSVLWRDQAARLRHPRTDKFKRATQYIGAQAFDTAAIEWNSSLRWRRRLNSTCGR